MSDVKEKIRHLVKLARNEGATLGESRNAALKAAELALQLADGGQQQSRRMDAFDELALRERIRFLESQVRGARINDSILQTEINTLRIRIRELEQQVRNGSSPAMPRQNGARAQEPRPVENGGRWDQRPDRGGPRKMIRSQYAGTCRRCKEPFEIGDMIAWAAGRGALHPDCYEDEKEECA